MAQTSLVSGNVVANLDQHLALAGMAAGLDADGWLEWYTKLRG